MHEPASCRCPSCSGFLTFDIASQMLRCRHCDSRFSAAEYDAVTNQGAAPVPEHPGKNQASVMKRSYSCSSCGGAIFPGILSAVAECPFCGQKVTLADKITARETPDFIIPFKKDREFFREQYRDLLSRRHFIPRSFRAEAREESIMACYIPFWIYDVAAAGEAKASCEKIVKKGDRKWEHTVFACAASGSREFQGIPGDGSREIPERETQSIEPFDIKDAVPFSPAYLAGLDARIASRNAKGSFNPVEKRVRTSLDSFLIETEGYDACRITQRNYRITPVAVKYALLPVWRMETSWRGQVFSCAMNGETGKITGDFPAASRNIAFATLFFTALAMLVITELGFLADFLPGYLQLLIILPMLITAGGIWYLVYLTRIPWVFQRDSAALGGGALAFLITAGEIFRLMSSGSDGETALMVMFPVTVFYFFVLRAALKGRLAEEAEGTLLRKERDAEAYAVPSANKLQERRTEESGSYISGSRAMRKEIPEAAGQKA